MLKYWLNTMKTKALVLDLDDTLYAEIDYLRSAYVFIAQQLELHDWQKLYDSMLQEYQAEQNVFQSLTEQYAIEKEQLLDWYRYHQPTIRLFDGVKETLDILKGEFKFAIITDGRSITQRNKIKALELENYCAKIIISEEVGSEKPNKNNYLAVANSLNCMEYIYIGDNLSKDFITPNILGWRTICLLDSGQNIHQQNLAVDLEYQAQIYVKNWYDIQKILL